MQWSPQQNEALAKAGAWLRLKWSPFFYLAGYAGTGKTTLAKHLTENVDGRTVFAAFTGKAAQVMRRAGCEGATTIHSLIYNTEIDHTTGATTVTLKGQDEIHASLIVIDECSMVDEELGRDLLSFGIPILVLGDPAQLPPVRGGGFFTGGLPDYMLTEVHRHAGAVLRLATEIREGRWSREEVFGDDLTICARVNLDPSRVHNADMVIVGRNETRRKFNLRLREIAGHRGPLPQRDEPVICLRNDSALRISNGELFTIASARTVRDINHLRLEGEGDRPLVHAKVRQQFFEDDVQAAKLPFKVLKGTQQFTYGYAITCHKSQGSQWNGVCVFDESAAFREHADRWLYTAVTRSSEHLTLVI